MLKRTTILIILLITVAMNIKAQSFTIAAAADLRHAMDEIVNAFTRKNPTVKIEVIYGSSGSLFQQIINKAPFDIFFSADKSYSMKLYDQNFSFNKPTVYAVGHLVLWSLSKDVTKGLSILKSSDIRQIAIANPEVAPYGKRAIECLSYYKLFDIIKGKLVKGDNVSQAAQFVLTGNADVGIIALSLALSPEMSGKGKYFLINEKSYSKQEQSFVLLKNGSEKKELNNFVKFLDTKEVKVIFSKYGFKLPN